MADKKITQFDTFPSANTPTLDTYFVLASGTDVGGENYKINFYDTSQRVLNQVAGGNGAVIGGDNYNINFGAITADDINRDVNFQLGGVNKMVLTKEGQVNIQKDLTVSGIVSGASGIFGDSLTVGGQPVLTGDQSALTSKWLTGTVGTDIYYSDGNVGIRTNNPQWPLHTLESSQGSGIVVSRLISPTTAGTHIAATGVVSYAGVFTDTLTISGNPVATGASSPGGAGVNWSSVPASTGAAGTAGSLAYDGSYFYLHVGASGWRRTALGAW